MARYTLKTHGKGSRVSLPSRTWSLFVAAMIHSTGTCALLSQPSNIRTRNFTPSNRRVATPEYEWTQRTNRKKLQFLSKRQSGALASSMAPLPQSNLAVRLDRPILAPIESCCSARSSTLWPSLLAVLLSDVCKTAVVAFFLATGVSLAAKFLSQNPVSGTENGNGGIRGFYHRIKNFFSNVLSAKSQRVQRSTPMPFEGDGGWGKCTLRSKRKIGAKFTVYEFALPKSEYSLPLALGQQLDFCCLSLDDNVVTGSFYPYDTNDGERGVVRVVVPNTDAKGNSAVVGPGSSKFIEVLHELRPGEEVAIRPGKSTLTYRGEHVPVTDMVYMASGLGIVPIVDQVKAITPKGSSSVKVISVVWINDERSDFDLAMDELEKEYTKYSTKLAVSCILDDVIKNPMEENVEVDEAVPYFNAGTMAVISGPKRFSEKAKAYLMRKGYPENCVCVLP